MSASYGWLYPHSPLTRHHRAGSDSIQDKRNEVEEAEKEARGIDPAVGNDSLAEQAVQLKCHFEQDRNSNGKHDVLGKKVRCRVVVGCIGPCRSRREQKGEKDGEGNEEKEHVLVASIFLQPNQCDEEEEQKGKKECQRPAETGAAMMSQFLCTEELPFPASLTQSPRAHQLAARRERP